MTSPRRDEPAASAATSTAPLLRVTELGVRYPGADAAVPAGADLTIARGEVVLLLGPSGSGKSTLALTLNGLIPQAVPATVSGSVQVAGADAATTPVAQLATQVGMVFQDPDAQLVTGSVLDEVAFGPENLRMPAAEVLARSKAALRRVGLWQRRHENPDRLSGGGRQRLAIACALALGSPLLVLDEPTANLDPQGIDEVYAALAELVAAGDHAILLVEHNLDAAMALVDRVVVLDHDGRTFAAGPAAAVLRGRAAELHEMGVWLPTATIAALRLRSAGYALDPLPLTPAELHSALEEAPAPDAASVPPTRTPPPVARRAPPLVRVRGLTVSRGQSRILHGVDLDVHAGEFVAVVGANGAGKTTLVQAIAGVVRPPRGAVQVGDIDPGRADARTLHRRIGFVFQNPEHQFIAHTVFDELAHGLRLQKLPEAEVRERTLEVLARFGLAAKADVHPFLLSGGQKRRLSVGTALVAGAPVLALDEPTFGQDRARADELLGLLRDLNRQGTTIIVVSHDMQLVAEYADRTIVLGDGRVLASGPTPEVFADDDLLLRAGLRPPPLRQALHGVTRHPELAAIARLADLPGGAT
ncbi:MULTISPECIES: energy-coupling factor transporter ATPase [unclassified Microbacterium]|uniref:ABC transporter ATP-binding protein n=1 Tax=unclassified Microbacterium TaxID=2609290 RepID=UPI00214AF59B|nr:MULTISPECIES: energy-coupling factor transporter ATPase [unclassified Microbacterium]MCR2784660.1 energy-coupling factor transporter ATPase [Microbacterium sp. zg.B96]WIM16202.1 energy-coupling factor transporter ATPase [Microbacterium sp. zg-B96]